MDNVLDDKTKVKYFFSGKKGVFRLGRHQPQHKPAEREKEGVAEGGLKCFAIPLLIGMLVLYAAMMALTYYQLYHYTLDEKKHEIHKMVLIESAVRDYVDHELKPLFYQLKLTQSVDPDFYTPKGFSATYVISHIFKQYQTLLEESFKDASGGVHYHIASDNPLNLANLVDEEALERLKYFRSHPEAFEAWEIESDATPPRMTLFRPSLPNNANCLRCHGDPKQAPKGLVKIYGTDHGFHEPIGWIRGVSVYEVNLTQDLSRFHHLVAGIAVALFLLLAIIYGVVLWVHGKLQKDQQIILQQKEALYQLANQDALTGLFNRHKLESDLPKLLEALRQERLTSLAVILLDIDHFKRFNDTYGHDVGDLVLQSLAKGLKSHCKEASPFFYRLGGEEFLVLLPYVDKVDKQKVIERVSQCQKELPCAIEEIKTHITYSIGIAMAETGDTPQTLLKKADLALYYVKENGRNGVHLYDESVAGEEGTSKQG